ncbi:MAG: hypothetical protein FWD71_17065 [Oscillospiraceae bacterium]|nr:hypothetical protein [Oscillospiraceae bacterium]
MLCTFGDEFNHRIYDELDGGCPCYYCNYADSDKFNLNDINITTENSYITKIAAHESEGGCHSCRNHGGGYDLFEWNGELWF